MDKRATGKILTLSYQDMLNDVGDKCSYCLSPTTVGIALAFMDYARWSSRYVNAPDGVDQTVIDAWVDLAENELMNCIDGALVNFNTEIAINNTFSLFSGETPQEVSPFVPDTYFASNTGDSPTQHQERIDALCYACLAFVELGCGSLDKLINDAIDESNLVGGLSALAAVVTTVLFPEATLFLVAYGLLSGAAYTASASLSFLDNDIVRSSDAQSDAACQLYTGLSGLAITEANLYDTIYALGDIGGTDAQKILAGIAIIMADAKQPPFSAFVKALGDANRLAAAGLLPECPCCATDPLIWDWFDNVDDLTGWSVISSGDFDPTLTTTLNDAAGTYHAELHANADGLGHSFVFPSGNGFASGHEATGMQFDVDNGGCRLKLFEVTGNNGDATDTTSKLWVHTADGWHYVGLLDFTSGTTAVVTKSIAVDEPGVDKVAIINYSGGNMYMAKLRLAWG